jgi:hypothetical protein
MNESATPQPPPIEAPLSDHPDLRTLFESLLRRPHALAVLLMEGKHGAIGKFAAVAVAAFLLFGLVLGCFAKHGQLWAAPVKTTAGLFFAAVICFPSLYIFATLAGARIAIGRLAACLAAALALSGLLLLGFAPAVWIFAESTDSFGFVGFLGIASWIVALLFALRFLKAAAFAAGGGQKGPLAVWSVVFLLVTLQMTTSLRPILGRSEHFLPHEKKFFLQHWGEWMGKSLGDSPPKPAANEPQNQSPPSRGGRNPHLED